MDRLKILSTALLLFFLTTACRSEFNMGSGTYFVSDTAFKDEVEADGKLHEAGEGKAFLEVEYMEIYDGEKLQSCCIDSSAFVTDATGTKYELRFTGMTVRGGNFTVTKGRPNPQLTYTITFGPMPRNVRNLKLHVEDQEIGL